MRRRRVAGRDRLRLPQVGRQRDHRGRHCGADAVGERHVRAGNRGVPRLRHTVPSGLVAVADDEQGASRSGRRQLREPVSRQADAWHARPRLHSGHGTVRGRLRGERQHPEPAVPCRHARHELAVIEQLARVAVVRCGQAVDEIRLSGRIPDGRSLPVHEQPVHDVPHEQRQAGSDQRDHRLTT